MGETMNLTTIQLKQDTKKKLEQKKLHPRESYDEVIQRVLELEGFPSVDEVVRIGNSIKQDKIYSTDEVIALTHRLRGKA
ncbi:MAG TPA: hypothetical protein VJG90_00265 [Candidatus Nanoarchaeia archaeon]|nr:hypothetical protein [Candidatus Nanoarchaeia archaeon]